MKRKTLFQLFALGLMFHLAACQNPVSATAGEEGNLDGGQWLTYSELQCDSNPWGTCAPASDTNGCVKKYVQDQGFTVLDLTMTPAPADFVSCAACHCPTGRSFKVKVKEADAAKLLAVGFKKQ
ncbi:hypothetical protein ACFSC6_19155 [Rufibacter sediminis]|uniref:Lipoprotein n=1 Tax=Rufibacter sediminis TaxID=2762756 RepID=A0ABR6VR12_9BACT|nr:hypothetical protein [Rufibacter sediminis]MBC3539642.1 hypothetical protein [Rufibacter sediminis]